LLFLKLADGPAGDQNVVSMPTPVWVM